MTVTYIRASPEEGWREMKGNRCMKFLPVGDNLFCAFVAKNDEKIGAPKRTDITYGWLAFFPIVYWSNEQAAKLVLAQELEGGWAVRAVLDPDTELDADSDFVVGIDNRNIFHFLYYTSRGGGIFAIIASPAGGGSYYKGSEPSLRYSQIPLDRLLHFTTSAPQTSGQNLNPRDWLPIKGFPMSSKMPFVKKWIEGHGRLSPLSFIVDRTSGELQGLIHTDEAYHLKTDDRELMFAGSDHGWLGVSLLDGHWAKNFDVITATGLPEESFQWMSDRGVVIRNNSLNDIYVLVKSWKPGFWGPTCFMTCVVKNKLNWSAPLVLGSTNRILNYSRTIAVDDYGRAFAAWVDGEGRFVGRWLTSH